MVTIYDIAKKANVSAMTVSRVINKSALIKEETRIKVEKAIQELDYIPNRSARSLISKDSKLLSLIITDITNPFFTQIARGAEDQAERMGYQVVFSNSDENMSKESAYIRSSVSRSIDGVLFAPSGDASSASIQILKKYHIPFVLIDREIEGIESDIVKGNNKEAVQQVMNHLFEYGHRRIALLTGPEDVSNTRERESAYRECMQRKNLLLDETWIQRSSLRNIQIDDIISNYMNLSIETRPTAILATNNFLAVNVLQSFYKRNIQVPDIMSIVCFDDPSPIPEYDSQLTVISQPAYELGSVGMQLLLDRIEGVYTGAPKKVLRSSELIIRRSVLRFN